MSLLRKLRTEMDGAWRSLWYDLGRRPAEPPAGGPDMTSTGLNTFGGMIPVPPQPQPKPRRAVLVTTLGVLAAAGAAGAYLAVASGLGSALSPAAAGTLPAAPHAPTVSAEAQLGVAARATTKRPVAPPTTPVAARPAKSPGVAATTTAARPVRTVKPANTKCPCGAPPVPTPTAPTSVPSATPSRSGAASASPSASASPTSPSASASPSETSDNPGRRRRLRHG